MSNNNLYGYDLAFTEIVLASDIGINGNLFGGRMMSWLDKAATLFITKKIKSQNIVTANFGEMNFIEKVKEKEIVKIFVKITRVGKSSISVAIKACKIVYQNYKEHLIDVVYTSAVFVHIDETGKPKQIPLEIEKKLFSDVIYSNTHPYTCDGNGEKCVKKNGKQGELINKIDCMICPCGSYKEDKDE